MAIRARRHIERRFDRETVKVTSYLGRDFAYPADSMIGRHVAARGAWDAILATIVDLAFVEPDPFICEVGSNIGASLLQILRGKPGARVLALEPSEAFRPFLMRNLAAVESHAVRVSPAFVGSQAGTTWLYNNETTASAWGPEYADHEPRGRQLVEVDTLDRLLSGEGRVDFIKVDTDGFDFDVLAGGEHVLQRDRPLLFFELAPDLAPDSATRLGHLQELGYRRFICLSPGQAAAIIGVTEIPDQAVEWASASGYCDILCCNSEALGGEALSSRLERGLHSAAQ